MEESREPRNLHIYGQLMTKMPRIYNGESTVSSVNGSGKSGQPRTKE